MSEFNKQLEQLAELQRKNMEPLMAVNTVTAQAFERLARQNYALMGDLVEFAVAQVNIPAGKTDPQGVYEEQVAETRAFAEKVSERANEYVELASELGEMVTSHVTGPMEILIEENMKSAQALTSATLEEAQAAATSVGTAAKAAPAKEKPAARKAPAKKRGSKA